MRAQFYTENFFLMIKLEFLAKSHLVHRATQFFLLGHWLHSFCTIAPVVKVVFKIV